MTLSELNESLDSREVSSERKRVEIQSATKTEVNKRFSFSLACIAFALIAVPLGVTAQRRETSIGFAISLGIALTYFMFIIIADTFRNNPNAYPHLLVWVPNVIFIGLGLYLFRRMLKR